MARKKKKTMWVIFPVPRQIGRPGTHYIDKDGRATKYKKQAMKFFTYGDAKEFADSKGIKLTETCYIEQEDFPESDM